MHSQRKRNLKSLQKFLKNQQSINVAPFNKDVAPGKKKHKKLISVPLCLFRTLEVFIQSISPPAFDTLACMIIINPLYNMQYRFQSYSQKKDIRFQKAPKIGGLDLSKNDCCRIQSPTFFEYRNSEIVLPGKRNEKSEDAFC